MTTQTPIKFAIAINQEWPGEKLPHGDPRWPEHTASFHVESHTIESLTKRVTVEGYGFSAVMKDGWRKETNFISAQHIGLDDDRGTQESSLEALAEDPFIENHGALLYASLSSTPEHPKSRILFVLDTPFTESSDYRTAQEAMCWKFGATDPQVKDPARFFYGRPNADHINLGNVLYRDTLQEEVIEPYLHSLGDAGSGHKPAGPIGQTVPKGSRNATMASIVGTMWYRGMSKDAITAAAHTQNEQTFDPPLPADEVDSVVASITRKPRGALPVVGEGSSPLEGGVKVPPKLKITTMGSVLARKVLWLWPGRIPQGKLTVIAGDPGLGKSLLTLDMAARVSFGGPWPDIGIAPLGDVLLITAEDGLDDTVRPRLDLLEADVSRIHAIEISVDDNGENVALSLTEHLPQIEEAVATYAAILLVIDPILALTGRKDTHKASDVRAILAPLAAMAERTGCAVVTILHLNKNSKEGNALYRVTSSLDFVAAARSALVVGEHPDDPDRRVLASIKANLSAKPALLGFHIDDRGCFIWDGVVDLDVHALLNVPLPDEKAARDEAKDFLLEVLKNGPRPAAEVQTEARQYGITDTTLKRAAKDLELQKIRVGGIGKDGHWEWALAKDGPSPTGDPLSKNGHLSSDSTPETVVVEKQGDLLSGGPEWHGGPLSKETATKEVNPNGPLGTKTTKKLSQKSRLPPREKVRMRGIVSVTRTAILSHTGRGGQGRCFEIVSKKVTKGDLENDDLLRPTTCTCEPIRSASVDGLECPACNTRLWCAECGGCRKCRQAVQAVSP